MPSKTSERRQHSTSAAPKVAPKTHVASNDRTARALKSAAGWLRRRGARRQSKDVQTLYRDAANMINDLAKHAK